MMSWLFIRVAVMENGQTLQDIDALQFLDSPEWFGVGLSSDDYFQVSGHLQPNIAVLVHSSSQKPFRGDSLFMDTASTDQWIPRIILFFLFDNVLVLPVRVNLNVVTWSTSSGMVQRSFSRPRILRMSTRLHLGSDTRAQEPKRLTVNGYIQLCICQIQQSLTRLNMAQLIGSFTFGEGSLNYAGPVLPS